MPDSNHSSVTQRIVFRPVWNSDGFLDVPPEVGRTGKRRSQSASPCFQSTVPRISNPRVARELGPGSYHIPDYVDRKGSHAKSGDLSVAAFKDRTLKPSLVANPSNCPVGPGAYDLSATDIAAKLRRNFPTPSAVFKSGEPRGLALMQYVRSHKDLPAPGTYFQPESPGQSQVTRDLNASMSCSAFGTTAPRFPKVHIPQVPPPGAYDVWW
jgi:hypothetical protein